MSDTVFARMLDEWIEQGGELDAKLTQDGVRPEQFVDPADAKAVCRAVASDRLLNADPEERLDDVRSLISCFQSVGSKATFEIFRDEGLPHLRAILQQNLPDLRDQPDVPLFIAKVLAMYAQEEDAARILETARSGWADDQFIWSVILDAVDPREPGFSILFEGLRNPLPPKDEPLGIAYLDFANRALRETDTRPHPFDSEEGVARLHEYILGDGSTPENEEEAGMADGRAHSATGALAFLEHPEADELTRAASRHSNLYVRMEAAWAMAMRGDPLGEEQLRDWATEPSTSRRAIAFLEELGATEELPYPCNEPDFQATAEMCDWLQHPQEYGRAPDSIEIYDHRELFWTPTDDRRPVWLMKYSYDATEGSEADVGIGMVGSVTFALFGETTADMIPEDLYAVHCCWELEATSDPRFPGERTVKSGRRLLAEKNPEFGE